MCRSVSCTLALVICLASGGTASAAAGQTAAESTGIDSCTTVTDPGTYELTGDIENTTSQDSGCIRILADDVVLDGGGHALVGDHAGEGVNVTGSNVTVTDLRVVDWVDGVVVHRGNDTELADLVLRNNRVGIRVGSTWYSTARTRIRNVTATDSRHRDVLVRKHSDDTVVTDSTFVSTGETIYSSAHPWTSVEIRTSDGSVVRGSTFYAVNAPRGSGPGGLLLSKATTGAVVANNSFARIAYPLRIRESHGNVLRNNTARNGSYSIVLDDARDNEIVDNTLLWNHKGIQFDAGSDHNRVVGNRIVGDEDGPAGLWIGWSDHNVFVDNVVRNAPDEAMFVRDSTNTTIQNLTVTDSSEHARPVYSSAVQLKGADRARIANSTVARTDGTGIHVTHSSAVKIVGTTVTNGTKRSVIVASSPRAVLVGNTVRNDRGGAVVLNSPDAVLEDNRFIANGGHGALVSRSPNATLVGNLGRENEWAGLRLEASDGSRLRANVVEANGVSGVRVANASGVDLADTVARDNAFGVQLTHSPRAVLEDATVTGNDYDGVRLFASNDSAVRNVTATDDRIGVHVVASARTTVTDTVTTDNAYAGVRIQAESWKGRGGVSRGHSLENVTSRRNGVAGVRLEGTTATTLTDVDGSDGPYGVRLRAGSAATLRDVAATNVSRRAVVAREGSAADATGVVVDSAAVGFDGTEFAVDAVDSTPSPPEGYVAVDRSVRTTGTGPDAALGLTVRYTDAVVADSGANESTLRLWRYDGGNWSLVDGENTVDTSANRVHAAAAGFGVLAPLGERTETNDTTAAASPSVSSQPSSATP